MNDIFKEYNKQIIKLNVDVKEIIVNYNNFKEFFGISQTDHLFTEQAKLQDKYILGLFYNLVASKNLICIDKDEYYFNLVSQKDNTKHQAKILNVSMANINQIMKLDINKPQSFNFLFETPSDVNLWNCKFNSNVANLLKIVNFFLIGDLSV